MPLRNFSAPCVDCSVLTMSIYRRSWSIPAHLVLCACVQAGPSLKPGPEQCQLCLLRSRLELSLELLVFKKRTGEGQPTTYSWMLGLVNTRAFTCPIRPSRVRRDATISVSSCPNTHSSSANNKHRQRRSQGSLTGPTAGSGAPTLISTGRHLRQASPSVSS